MLLQPDPAAAEDRALQIGRRGEEPLRQLANTLDDVFWIYEPHCARFFYVSPAYERDWARSADALYADASEWFAPVHDDDRPLLRAAFDRLAFGEGYAIEYREVTRSGSHRWISERAIRGADVCGQPLRFAGVSHDITARKNVDSALLRTHRRKDEFLSVLSHELRSPLQPLRTAAALLALQRSNVPEIEKAVAVIERQVEHMSRLIEDLLDVSRISHGKIGLRSDVVPIGDAIEAAIEANRALIQANRLELQVNAPASPVCVLGDPVRLTQVFSNLLHNAAKFSSVGGRIEVTVRAAERERQVIVSMRDQGIGIARELIDSVFDLFMQDPQALVRGHGGLGIGLSVVRNLVELHGGQVSVHSDGVAKGSEFVVALPSVRAPAAHSAVAPVAATPHRSKRVLLVDDDRDTAESLQALLEMDGHTVAVAFTGQAALEQAARVRPEIVILDVSLPDISGYDIARRLRADSSLPPSLLVAVTGTKRGQELHASLQAGFDHHFVKPASPAILLHLVGMNLSSATSGSPSVQRSNGVAGLTA
jgi:PAS domain S-box-containing protein